MCPSCEPGVLSSTGYGGRKWVASWGRVKQTKERRRAFWTKSHQMPSQGLTRETAPRSKAALVGRNLFNAANDCGTNLGVTSQTAHDAAMHCQSHATLGKNILSMQPSALGHIAKCMAKQFWAVQPGFHGAHKGYKHQRALLSYQRNTLKRGTLQNFSFGQRLK